MSDNKGEILLYQTDDGKTKIEVVYVNDSVWMSIDKIAELFQKGRTTILHHIQNIYEEGELDESRTCQYFRHVRTEGKRDVEREIEFYNLPLIIAVGYRVKSHRGIQFRQWATALIEEFMKKGFVMNDDLLKESGGGGYFKELLDRIRDIRSSEKVFYRQILDIYATSIDYDAKEETTIKFFKTVQNKMLFAVNGMTAAELITERANAQLPFMGLQSFCGIKPSKDEAVVAKNYLVETEIKNLNYLVSAFLDLAERQALLKKPMYMRDWQTRLDNFLRSDGDAVLENAGTISHETAVEHAEAEYEKYKQKSLGELTQVEKDFLETIHKTYELLERKKPKNKKEKKG